MERSMTITQRLLLAVGILLVDLLIFFLPLTAFFLIYILMYNPSWFRDFLNSLDHTA
jgi:hypothetical protein